MLSKEQLEEYKQTGVVCIEGFASAEEVKSLQGRGLELVRDFDPANVTIFSTKTDDQSQFLDKYFLDSASNISFFFEENAFDSEGKLTRPKELAINKIGHALHELDPAFRSFSTSNKMQALLRDLGYSQPMPIQSTFIFKQPHIGGEVTCHQDSTFLWTDPPSVVGLWVALEDATKENGCLWTLPGSHKDGVVRRFLMKDGKLVFDKANAEYDIAQFQPLEVKAGTMVAIHGANVHYSADNTSPHSRHAYIVHVIEGAAPHEYLPDNWLQRSPELPLKPLYQLVPSA